MSEGGGQSARCRAFWLGQLAIASVALLPVSGCSEEMPKESASFSRAPATAATVVADRAAPVAGKPLAESAPGDVPPALPRKIIFNAQVTLVVEDVATVGEQITKLVKDAGGYISETDQSSFSHVQRTATWKVRVPVEKFDGFLAAVSRLGELQRNHVDSQDVTQEYYDTEARISNKQQEEKRLLKHLADSTGKLQDILAVEKELSRVRSEVEQMQGRLKYLAAYSAMSTVTISASEVRDFVPPVAPTFGKQISRTFHASVDGLLEFGRAVVLLVVAIAPWLPLVLIVVLPIWLFLRRRRVTLTRTPRNP